MNFFVTVSANRETTFKILLVKFIAESISETGSPQNTCFFTSSINFSMLGLWTRCIKEITLYAIKGTET